MRYASGRMRQTIYFVNSFNCRLLRSNSLSSRFIIVKMRIFPIPARKKINKLLQNASGGQSPTAMTTHSHRTCIDNNCTYLPKTLCEPHCLEINELYWTHTTPHRYTITMYTHRTPEYDLCVYLCCRCVHNWKIKFCSELLSCVLCVVYVVRHFLSHHYYSLCNGDDDVISSRTHTDRHKQKYTIE